jgi:hypothetical protein
MTVTDKTMTSKLRWMSVGGCLLILLGILVTVGNQGAGVIIGLLGIATLMMATYIGYDIGKSEKTKA